MANKNYTLNDVREFLQYVREKKILAGNTVSGWANALGAVAEHLSEEESNVAFLQDNLEIIKNRLSNGNKSINGATLVEYVNRIKRVTANFLEWKDNRAAWEKKVATQTRKPASKKKEDDSVSEEESFSSTTESKSSPQKEGTSKFSVPTTNGGFIDISCSPTPYTMGDVVRVAWILAASAQDFNPEVMLKSFGAPPKAQPSKEKTASLPDLQ